MDEIMREARRLGLRVIEDVSHAHGGLFKGRKVGTFGDAACFSLMAGKPLAVGEAGMITTNDRDILERAVAFGHYERFNDAILSPELRPFMGLPLGGYKNRMHQLSAAVGRVQLRYYDRRAAEIRKAMNHFWDLLDGVPGIRAHRVDERTGSTMGGWYAAHGHYVSAELGGLSLNRFCEAVRAEGMSDAECMAGCNRALHLHPVFNAADIYNHGKPTRIAHTSADIRQPSGSLPVAEAIPLKTFFVPWFKHFAPEEIARYASAFRKVAEHADELLADDPGEPATAGGWNLFRAKTAAK
jgi:dTDP-4-amino-4,6-dideoxygalactose transaminase